MDNTKYCPKCQSFVAFTVEENDEVYSVKGEPVAITAKVCKCAACGEALWDDVFDNQNLVEAFQQYRRNHHLLLPEEIRRIREKYRISQVGFARVLGVGDKTIARYENGSLQDEAINNLILLASQPQNFSLLLKKNKKALSDADCKRLFIPAVYKNSFPYLSVLPYRFESDPAFEENEFEMAECVG